MINVEKKSTIVGILAPKCRMSAPSNARIKLTAGPERAIKKLSREGWRRLRRSTGTGLPQPMWINIKASVPKGSRCARGFSVSLPLALAVGSPSRFAVQAWAASWKLKARRRLIIKKIANIILIIC